MQESQQTVVGVLDRIVYCNEENQYCIGELKVEKVREPMVVAGMLPGIQCGETLKLIGEWITHPKYGRQFKIKTFESTLPASVYGIKKYLGSGLVPGIGRTYAEKIVERFGQETFRIISEESARLMEIPGIGRQRAHAIKTAWDSQVALRDVMLFLKTYGVGTAQCLRLVKQYGNEAKAVLENNPYQVAREITGIGFKTADQIAHNLGLGTDSPKRIDAGILFAMEDNEADGHTCIEHDKLLELSQALLGVDISLINERIAELVAKKVEISLVG